MYVDYTTVAAIIYSILMFEFCTLLTYEKRPQINFSCQNFNIDTYLLLRYMNVKEKTCRTKKSKNVEKKIK